MGNVNAGREGQCRWLRALSGWTAVLAIVMVLGAPAGAGAYLTTPATMWTIAGTGTVCAPSTGACGDGPTAPNAQLNQPNGVAVDAAGNVYVADSRDNKVRKVTPGGAISTIAGNGRTCTKPTCGDGPTATNAQLYFPSGVAVDTAGNVYVADATDNKVRKVTPGGAISTIAGDGTTCGGPP